jgi:plasmanylethanolamine desaturase
VVRDIIGAVSGQRILEQLSVGVFALLAGLGAWRIAAEAGFWFFAVVALAAPLGWLLADLLGGLVHFAFDTWGSVRTPVLGKAFVRPFREHHVDPEAMTRHDFAETHGSSCLAALPVLFAVCLGPLPVLLQAVMLFTAFGALATNQCHKWAHMEEAATPRIVRRLQRLGIVLRPEHHRRHHTAPFNTHFCTSAGWMNPAFDSFLKMFR